MSVTATMTFDPGGIRCYSLILRLDVTEPSECHDSIHQAKMLADELLATAQEHLSRELRQEVQLNLARAEAGAKHDAILFEAYAGE